MHGAKQESILLCDQYGMAELVHEPAHGKTCGINQFTGKIDRADPEEWTIIFLEQD